MKEGIQSTYYYLEMCGVSLEVFILFIVAILIFLNPALLVQSNFDKNNIDGKVKTIRKRGIFMGTILSAKIFIKHIRHLPVMYLHFEV